MENLKTDIIGIIFQLLPGFISTWIFYTLSSYIKPQPFERIIQALIYTVITKVTLILVRPGIFFIGKWHSFGPWTTDTELVYQIGISFLLGLIAAWCVNNDFPLWLFRAEGHRLLVAKIHPKIKAFTPKFISKWLQSIVSLKLTNKTLHPTEWYSFFRQSNSLAILHLEGERRIHGIISQFPDSPLDGHFILLFPTWLLEDGSTSILPKTEKMLISSKEVLRIEILTD